jgi:hypothetical protein
MPTLLTNRIGQPPATGTGGVRPYPAVIASATAITSETTLIERDADLHHRVVARLANPGETIPVEDILGPLDEVEDAQTADQE